jgi:exopolysaccharide production protein ExoQ
MLALGVTACFGLYLAVSFSVRWVLSQVVVAMLAGLMVSYLAVVRLWEGSRNLVDDYWIGIYLNRNSLAPVAAMGMLSALLLMINRRLRGRGDTLTLVACLVVAGSSGVMLYQSESATSVIALLISGVVVAVWLGVSRLMNVNINPSQSSRVLAATVVASALVIGTALTYVAKSASVFGRVETFSARAPIWSMNWSGFLERPLLGWGWQAAWHVPQFFKQGVWWVVSLENNWAHSGYFDLLLGGGVVAGLLFAGWVLVSCFYAAPSVSHSPTNNHNQHAPVAMSIFVLAAATQESFFIGSHILWALLVWGLTSAALGGRVSSRAENPPTSAANAVPAASPR